MKSAEEILRSYYTQGSDGMPEIAADGLMKAMEEYRLQAEAAAFSAARQISADGSFTYADIDAYREGLLITATPEDDVQARVRIVAESIFELFLPQDGITTAFSFPIRTEGKAYMVNYRKDSKGLWMFDSYAEAN